MLLMDYFAFQGFEGEREKREVGLFRERGWTVRFILIHPRHGWTTRYDVGEHIILPQRIVTHPILNELLFLPLYILARYWQIFVGGSKPRFLYVQNFPDSYSVPLLFFGSLLRIPRAYEIADPWKEFIVTETATTARRKTRFTLYFTVLTLIERLAKHLATGLVFTTESLRRLHLPHEEKPSFLLFNYSEYINNAETLAEAQQLRKTLGLNSSLVLSYIGGFQSYRGVDDLLQSMVKVSSEDSSIRLLLVGAQTSLKQSLEQRIHELGIQAQCTLLGPVPNEQLAPYFAASDIGIIPYRRTPGTELCTPNKLFNYIVLGKPVIVSDLPELSRYVTDKRYGLKIPPDNPDELAKAILHLAGNQELRSNMSKNALAAADQYRYQNIRSRFYEFVQSIARTS